MKRILLILVAGIMGAGIASAQGAASSQAGASGQTQTTAKTSKSSAKASGSASASKSAAASATPGIPDLSTGTKIDATLTHPLDVKNNKVGDRVEAVAAHDVQQGGNVVLKKGTRLMGRVTEVQPRTKDHDSQLGIVFDHAMTINGQNMPFNATIKALAAAQGPTEAEEDLYASGGAAGRGGATLVSGTASARGAGVVNTSSSVSGTGERAAKSTSRSKGAVGGLAPTGRIAPNSSGVFGLQGLAINPAAAGAPKGSTIVSPSKNVHLDNGTQMLLTVSGHTQQK